MPKNMLIIQGHPDVDSFCATLAGQYQQGAEARGAKVRRLDVNTLAFDPILHKGYKVIQRLEPDLKRAQRQIKWADHLLFAYPMWWGSMPAVLKGFIDRVFLPGFAFKFRSETSYLWDGLLTGRSARLLITLDGPPVAVRLMYSDPAIHAMKGMTLEFCGIKPVRETLLGMVEGVSDKKRQCWLREMRELGARGR